MNHENNLAIMSGRNFANWRRGSKFLIIDFDDKLFRCDYTVALRQTGSTEFRKRL